MMIVVHYLSCLVMLILGYRMATVDARDTFDRVCGWLIVGVAVVSGAILLRGGL